MKRATIPSVVWFVLWFCSGPGVATAQQDVARRAEQLVRQLGADRFEQREKATAELMRLGPLARNAVRRGLESSDAEVRHRCRTILRVLEHRWLQEQLSHFLARPEESDLSQLPAWDHFLEVMDRNRKATLALYRHVAREHQVLLLNWNEPQAMQRLLERLIQAIYVQARTRVGGQTQPPPASTIAALFAASLHPQIKPSSESLHILLMLSYQGTFRTAVTTGPHSAALRQMLTRWLKHHQREIDPNRLLSWAISFQLPGALAPALDVVKNGGPNGHVLVQAMLVVARFGKREHAPLLKRHMKNERVVYQLRRRANDVLRVEVRDVALAVTIHLHGQDPKRFGFAELQRNSMLVFQPTSLGFSSQEARRKAFDRWKKFLETGKL